MPPHCDTRDGPVVKAAMKALETGNLNYVLIWIPKESETELKGIFEKTLRTRKAGKDAMEVADDWFFENTIRLHRAGEGAAYTGMKPAGLSEGPVVPRAEKAIETGDPKESIGFILKTVEDDLTHRFHHVMAKKKYDVNDVAAGREYIEAFIGWVVYSHHLWQSVTTAAGHGEKHEEKAGCGHH
ncbi:MAG: DUF6448 family protein [Methanoregula sp.]|uniref:DUF6448 family protein n=1 Tax=Methanoregula sp. TaxID=2052170 RepID=UPI003C2430F0